MNGVLYNHHFQKIQKIKINSIRQSTYANPFHDNNNEIEDFIKDITSKKNEKNKPKYILDENFKDNLRTAPYLLRNGVELKLLTPNKDNSVLEFRQTTSIQNPNFGDAIPKAFGI